MTKHDSVDYIVSNIIFCILGVFFFEKLDTLDKNKSNA